MIPLTEAMTAAIGGLLPIAKRTPLLAALEEVELRAARVPELERRLYLLERKFEAHVVVSTTPPAGLG